jgi:hypothetical protein
MLAVARAQAAESALPGKKSPDNVVDLRQVVDLQRARISRSRVLRWAAFGTAVAAMVLVFWGMGFRLTRVPGGQPMMTAKAPTASTQIQPAPKATQATSDDAGPKSTGNFEQVRKQLDENLFLPGLEPKDMAQTEPVSLDDVLNARKGALSDPDALGRISQWASLTADKAREIANDPNAALAAKIGAAANLPADEALPILVAAVAAQPNDPSLRNQLSSSYSKSKQPGAAAKAIAQAGETARTDPENALSQYRLAALLLDQGDKDGAAAALEQAQNLTRAGAYPAESAARREQALIAGGVNPDTARALSAITAGSEQYNELMALSQQLIDYGKQYEQAGDAEFAQQLYQSVRQMGDQVATSTSYSNEQLAGLDIEHAAVETLSQLAKFIESPQNRQLLAEQAEGISDALGGFVSFMGQVNDFFAKDPSTDLLRQFSNLVMNNGDLNLAGFFGKL